MFSPPPVFLRRWHVVAFALLLPCLLMAKVPTFNQRITCGPLRVPLPKGVSQEAPPAVETFTYTFTRGNKSGTEERFDPRQLWEQEQRLGKWTDDDGNTYELVAPTSVIDAFDKGFENKYNQIMPHVLKEEYTLNRKKVGKLVAKRLPQWLTDWTDKSFSAPQKLRGMSAVSQALFAEAPGMAALIVYLKSNPNQPYVLLITTPNDPASAWKTPLTRALSGFADAGKQLKSNQQSVDGWQTLEQPPYRLYSNLPKQQTKFLNTLLGNMQQMRKVYTTYLPEPKNLKVPTSVIRVFASPEEYRAYVGDNLGWSAGLFSSTHRELVVMGNAEEDSNKKQKDDIRSTTFHEGFHQYLFLITPPTVEVPIWFNEGHATFFETFERTRNGVKPTISPRLLQVKKDSRFCTAEGIALLMSFSREIFYHDKNRDTAYASAWVLVHWLRTEAPKELGNTLNDYYRLLCKGKTPQEAQAAIYTPAICERIAEGLWRFVEKHDYTH